jgi:23S rRNA (cytosine1962-C5)-methyltransferase
MPERNPQRRKRPARPQRQESPLSTAPEDAPALSADPNTPALAGAIISRRAADRILAGHVWVYASDIQQIASPELSAIPGLLPVLDGRGMFLGTALWSPSSQIALRLVSREAIESDAEWLGTIEARLRRAIALRRNILAEAGEGTDACRLVFSEADELPGLVVDKYGDLLIVQVAARGLDRPEIRETLAGVLREEFSPAAIIERDDPRIRELETLSAPPRQTLWSRNPDQPLTAAEFRLNGLAFRYDAASAQKTGAFLDQRLNYAAAARHAHGEALDVCTYQGGFALHLARTCPRVTGVDISHAALEIAEANLEANRAHLPASQVDWVEANAFDLLRDWSDSGARYDTIVLDPPAFAKSKRAAEGALRGYKELNLRAFKMLRPGGVLVTCSCSHHVPLADFTAVVAAAAGDAGRRVRLLERRGAAPDHPVILTIPETEYLKCLICAVD